MSAQASTQALSPAEFRAAVAKMRATYPNERSAVLPALRLAQERHGGWLPEEAFREVADALGETPAYCLSWRPTCSIWMRALPNGASQRPCC